jgi:isopenicillin-N N-acyltransferase-like protein
VRFRPPVLQVTEMDRYFPVIKLEGGPKERGRTHGLVLRDRIHTTIEFYRGQFPQPEGRIMEIASQFRQATRDMGGDLYLEIEALAAAAQVDPRWIYALNGRTELLSLNVMECTSLAFRSASLIGQNWDWDRELEELAVILDIRKEDGHRLVTMTEPGMVGKIGMNNRGLGVCLNFMDILGYQPYGIPLHVLLRTIMDSKTLNEALSRIEPYLPGKVGNIMIMDNAGGLLDIELAGDAYHSLSVDDRFVHTNHFLIGVENDPQSFPNTVGRYTRAKELVASLDNPSIESMKRILKDRGDPQYPICRKGFSHTLLSDDTSITVCTIIMDLKNLQIHITRGNPFDNPFTVFPL